MKMTVLIFLLLTCLWRSSVSIDNCGYYQFKIGDLPAASVSDGPLPFNNSILLNTVPATTLEMLLEDAFLPTDPEAPLGLQQNILYLEVGGRKCLVDTGSQGFQEVFGEQTGKLAENLDDMGIAAEDIDCILISHGHGDHIGGILEFPNAEVFFNRQEYDFWTGPQASFLDLNDNPLAPQLIEATQSFLAAVAQSHNLTFFEYGDEVLPGITALNTSGHSIYHTAFEIESRGTRLLFGADAALVAAVNIRRTDLFAPFDNLQQLGRSTRKALLEQLATDKILFHSFHDDFPGLFYVKKHAGRGKNRTEYSLVPPPWRQMQQEVVGPLTAGR